MTELFSIAGFFAAFVAGFIVVFLPCTYPMIIGYIALLVGGEKNRYLREGLKTTGWFFAGFTTVYIFFGSVAGVFGQFSQTTIFFNSIKPALVTAGAIFFILIGLTLLRVIKLPQKLQSMYSATLPKSITIHSWWGAAGTGAIFAAAWSPCIGPVLGGILVLSASSGSAIVGALLLAAFSFGMMVPMAMIAILYGRAAKIPHISDKILPAMRVIGGLLFIIIGISFFTGLLSFLGTIEIPFLVPYT